PWFSGLEADLHTELGVPLRISFSSKSKVTGAGVAGLPDAEEQRRVRSDVVVDVETDLEDRQTTIQGDDGPNLVPVVIQLLHLQGRIAVRSRRDRRLEHQLADGRIALELHDRGAERIDLVLKA